MLWMLSLATAAPIPAEDIVKLRRVGVPHVSPDGERVVFTSSQWSFDPDAKPRGDAASGWTRDQQIFGMPTEGGAPRPLTVGEEAAGSPTWSPDGKTLAFRRDSSVHLMPLEGGEARTVDLGELEPGRFAFSPDGEALRFVAVPPPTDAEEQADFEDGGTYRFERDARHARLYTVDLDGGEPEPLTDGSFHVIDFDESEKSLYPFALTVSDRNVAYDRSIERRLVLFSSVGDLAVPEGTGCVEDAAFSGDGQRLAWVSCETGGLTDALRVYDYDTGETRNVLAEKDPTVAGFVWVGDDLVVNVLARWRSELWRVSKKKGVTTLDPDGLVITGMRAGSDGRTVFLRTTDTLHHQLLAAFDTRKERTRWLYEPEKDVALWELASVDIETWTSPDGAEIEGLLYVPTESTAEPMKLVVMPHGGPDGVSLAQFDTWAHYFVSRGYAVFKPNYRGGIGYGRDFYSANRGRLGEIELMDIESGVDQLIADGRVDPEHLYYGGWSWGGYLTAWTIGHTDRYRAAVAGAAVVDTIGQYVGSDINHGSVADWEYTGRPWTAWKRFDAANPVRHLQNAKTPTLVLHGDADARVPFAQGLTLYRALEDLGVETELYVYPGAGHGLRDPAHRIHRLQTWADWYAKHLAALNIEQYLSRC